MLTTLKNIKMRQIHFIPKHLPTTAEDVKQLTDFIYDSGKILVLTGAGISTESGIRDYRSEEFGLYHMKRTNPYKPVQQNEFVSNKFARHRYWLRNYIGWPSFSLKEPNITHLSLTKLEKEGKVSGIVTQNVDSLHFKAKSNNVIELHGSAFRVKCLGCGSIVDRHHFQDILNECNRHVLVESFTANPDGDADFDESLVSDFTVPDCDDCGGIFQPDIVFFGGNVPKERHSFIEKNIDESDSLLVLGTSLTVFSSYRIILRASEQKKPIAIVNIGKTRGDALASLKLNARCGEIIPLIVENN